MEKQNIELPRIRRLVRIFGTQDRTADAVGATQAAVSEWINGGRISRPYLGIINRLLADYDVRSRWFEHWLFTQTSGEGRPWRFEIVTDFYWSPDGNKFNHTDREKTPLDKTERNKWMHNIIVDYLHWSCGQSGDYLAFWLTTENGAISHDVFYLDDENVSLYRDSHIDPIARPGIRKAFYSRQKEV